MGLLPARAGPGEAVGEFASSLGAVVDGVSAADAEVKLGVVDIVAGAFAEIGCGDPCRLAVQLAIDAALTSAGVPPSLPDFDQVVADLEWVASPPLGRPSRRNGGYSRQW